MKWFIGEIKKYVKPSPIFAGLSKYMNSIDMA
jgi:hypothetical protein